MVDTASAIIAASPADYVRRALHYYRTGLLVRQSEDQFHQFWLALETIAEGRKTPDKVPIECPKCGGPLRCDVCQMEPMRRPMALQAIRDVLKIIMPQGSEETFQRLNAVRNQLVHGRSRVSIQRKLGRPLTVLVNEAAIVAWHAIERGMPEIKGQLILRRGIDFTNREILASPRGSFDHDGPGEHPAEDKIPNMTISLTARFGPMPPPPDADK
jgi:hypothetical protein